VPPPPPPHPPPDTHTHAEPPFHAQPLPPSPPSAHMVLCDVAQARLHHLERRQRHSTVGVRNATRSSRKDTAQVGRERLGCSTMTAPHRVGGQ
jgi:hypothetical protein